MNNLFGVINNYSIAIITPKNIIKEVAYLKSELAKLIGKYNSQNSAAHISISSFLTDFMGAATIHEFLKGYVQNLTPFPVRFTSLASFPSTFHIAPDENSEVLLKDFMKRFHHECPKFSSNKYRTPHITIGRGLNQEKIQKAHELFKTIDIQFECDNIALRKLENGQFQIEEIFKFKN